MPTDVSFGLMKGSAVGDIAPLRRDLREFMIGIGSIKDPIGSCSYRHPDDFDAAQTKAMIRKLDEIEEKHHPARIAALKVRSNLVDIEFKRSRYRSV